MNDHMKKFLFGKDFDKKKNPKFRKRTWIIGGLFALFIIGKLLPDPDTPQTLTATAPAASETTYVADQPSQPKESKTDYDIVSSGQIAYVQPGIYVAHTKDDMDEMFNYINNHNSDALMDMLFSGRVVMTDNGAQRVTIVDAGIIKHKIKIMDGDNAGFVGYVPMEFIKKSEW
ncbi:hypothetical protein [Paenibacillus albus]|uniref:Uncharacterized protein n=1 Tax=Paenibacillus albus TaxID=2495582 RepID=A0A3S9A3V7_9BACL|nr:hypothetical protein [Paenibacillus albus]AZN40390.1 hypothetical protein EJC50_12575 [Paenibacillus albus]